MPLRSVSSAARPATAVPLLSASSAGAPPRRVVPTQGRRLVYKNHKGKKYSFAFGSNYRNSKFTELKTIEQLAQHDEDVKSLFCEMDTGSQVFHEAYFDEFESDERTYMRRGRASLEIVFSLEPSRRRNALDLASRPRRRRDLSPRTIHVATAASPRPVGPSTWRPRRRRDSSDHPRRGRGGVATRRTIRVAAAAASRPIFTDSPRGRRGVAATRLHGLSTWPPRRRDPELLLPNRRSQTAF